MLFFVTVVAAAARVDIGTVQNPFETITAEVIAATFVYSITEGTGDVYLKHMYNII